MSSRYSQIWNNINKNVMKSFYVAWSNEPDLKLGWSSETALFKLFPLAPLWRQFFSIRIGFAFFVEQLHQKLLWNDQLKNSILNVNHKHLIVKRILSPIRYNLCSILQNTFITVNFIWGHTFVTFGKNDQFHEPLTPPTPPSARPFYSQK